jgi:hypothetical protein
MTDPETVRTGDDPGTEMVVVPPDGVVKVSVLELGM